MKLLLERLERVGRAAEDGALVLLLGSMVLLAVLQIVLRQFFDSGIGWADELIKIIVLWLAMVAVSRPRFCPVVSPGQGNAA